MSNGHFTPMPGQRESMDCDVCGEKMNVKRNVIGATSWAGAMCGSKRIHDKFTCQHRETDWHAQAYKLRQDAIETASGILAELFEKEAMSIIQSKKATKKVSEW